MVTKLRVDKLKEAQKKGISNAKDMELHLLWDILKDVADNGSERHKNIAELILASGIKSVDQRDLVEDHIWKKPFASFAEFESAVTSEVPFKM